MNLSGFVAVLGIILLAPHLKSLGAWMGVALGVLSTILFLKELFK